MTYSYLICMLPKRGWKAVSNSVFVVSILLILVATLSLGVYVSKPVAALTPSQMSTTETSVSTAETGMMGAGNVTFVGSFTPQPGAMINNAWLIVASLGNGEYAVVVHAEGLEPNGSYMVSGPVTSGAMQTVPISTESILMNTTAASEFTANSQGTGLFWIVVNSNPTQTFMGIGLCYLPGMSMQNATRVASVTFTPTMNG